MSHPITMGKQYKKNPKFAPERENKPPLRPQTEAQADYLHALRSSQQVVSLGPAGTGKTYVAAVFAADLLHSGDISKIVVTRPNVDSGQGLGYLPGSLDEKMAPRVAPVMQVIRGRLGPGVFDCQVRKLNIEVVPFEYMRGLTFDNAFVLLDEAENATPHELKMFNTRIGENSIVAVNGDVEQSDLTTEDGLSHMVSLIKRYGLPVPIIEFSLDDVVRSDLCAQWVRAYHRDKTR